MKIMIIGGSIEGVSMALKDAKTMAQVGEAFAHQLYKVQKGK